MIPVNPIKASAIIPVQINAAGTPLNDLGISSVSNRSRIPLINNRAMVKPTPAKNPCVNTPHNPSRRNS